MDPPPPPTSDVYEAPPIRIPIDPALASLRPPSRPPSFTTQAALSGYFTPRGFQDIPDWTDGMAVAPPRTHQDSGAGPGDFNAFLEKNWPVKQEAVPRSEGQGEHSRLLELINQKAQLDAHHPPPPPEAMSWPENGRPAAPYLSNSTFVREPYGRESSRAQLDPDSGIELYNFIATSSEPQPPREPSQSQSQPQPQPQSQPTYPWQPQPDIREDRWRRDPRVPGISDYPLMGDGEYQFSPSTGSFRPSQRPFFHQAEPAGSELPPTLKIRIVNSNGEPARDPTPPAETQPFIHHRPPPQLIPTVQPPMPGGWAFDFVNWPPPPASKEDPSSSTGLSSGLLPAPPAPEPLPPRRGSKLSMTLSVGRSSTTPSSHRESEAALGTRRKSSTDHDIHDTPPHARRRIQPDGHDQSPGSDAMPLGQRKAGARSSGLPPSGDEERKVVIACFNCRSKKLRCDGAKPACAGCVRKGIQAECNYDVAVRRRGPGRKTKDPGSVKREDTAHRSLRRASSSSRSDDDVKRRISVDSRGEPDPGWTAGQAHRRFESALREVG